MKYKLLKDLPLAKAGTEVILKPDTGFSSQILTSDLVDFVTIGYILNKDIQEWLEEVKEEPKTIYDLKEGDEYWIITDEFVSKAILRENEDIRHYTECFLTEREAKRNKLLRELATRTDKWLPKNDDDFISFLGGCMNWNSGYGNMVNYHCGFVFRDEEEYNKYMTDEARDLLFNI